MKKDFEVTLTNLDGTPSLLQGDKPLLMRFVVHEGLLNTDPQMTVEEKTVRWRLVQKTLNERFVNITVEEAALIKKSVSGLPILLMGQVFDWLESDIQE